MPYNRSDFEKARWHLETLDALEAEPLGVDDALAFLVNNRQSLFGRRTTWFVDMNSNRAKTWANVKALLANWSRRLDGVYIEQRDGVEVVEEYDNPDTVFFVDPPYMDDDKNYQAQYKGVEFTEEDHAALLARLNKVQGAVMVCGYDNDLYASELKHWHRRQWQRNNDMGKTVSLTVREVLWGNGRLAELLEDQKWGLF